ncbi:helix-turn-helix transcriptional regulator [Actinokineospora auranticolor]|uniref:Helix-turn-helix protein n=1 Tax=Actinokineospora auranticolor TaxID=155976 RepID=A0A2S6GNR9_9PSEU|nr:helix-turn-helix transcriptional regulator [Actinokineospora auranticolor]PPK66857.1 helix-turn-helix protein [Actinokineospora auranticolor]
MGKSYSSAAYRELGGLLREARKRAGLSSTELSYRLDWLVSYLSRVESGNRPVSTPDVIHYLVQCGLKVKEMRPYVELSKMAERRQGYYLSDAKINGPLQSLIFHESLARSSIIYEQQVVNGLLQTPDYARSIIGAGAGVTEEEVVGAVHTRLDRRRILTTPNAGRFAFYIHEQALRLRIGTDKIMHEQLLHLVLVAAADNITVQIVPSDAGERSVLGGAFNVMTFENHNPMVYLDNYHGGGLILEDPDYVRNYRDLVPKLAEVALDKGQSREFMANLADEYDRGSHHVVGDVVAKEQL